MLSLASLGMAFSLRAAQKGLFRQFQQKYVRILHRHVVVERIEKNAVPCVPYIEPFISGVVEKPLGFLHGQPHGKRQCKGLVAGGIFLSSGE